MKRQLFYCDKCGRAFLMRSYLKNHTCEPVEETKPEMSRADLVELAKERGIKGAARMKKEDLEEALK